MPNQPKVDMINILLRIPKTDKQRIKTIIDELNTKNLGARYSIQSFIQAAIIEKIRRYDSNK